MMMRVCVASSAAFPSVHARYLSVNVVSPINLDGCEWDYGLAGTRVWWDVNTAPVPLSMAHVDAYHHKQYIEHALISEGYCGQMMSFIAFGDSLKNKIPDERRSLHYKHPPDHHGNEATIIISEFDVDADDSYRRILLNMVSSAKRDNGDFCRVLKDLRGRRFNILVARPSTGCHPLGSVATNVFPIWQNIAQENAKVYSKKGDADNLSISKTY